MKEYERFLLHLVIFVSALKEAGLKLMKVNIYFLVVFIYFFVNAVGLPFGLTWMSVFAPLFYAWILLKRKKDVLLPFLFVLLPFAAIHLTRPHLEFEAYLVSLLNLLLVYVSCQAFYTLVRCTDVLENVFRRILFINFFACLLAIPLYFTPVWDWVWMEQSISAGISDFRRLKLFTYEPSYYALLFMPLFFFFLFGYFFRKNTIRPAFLLPMLILPLLLSFSIGVIGAAFIALLLTSAVHLRTFLKNRRIFNALVYSGAIAITGAFILFVFFRDNPLFLRIANIFEGQDTSGKGRTVDAFILAQKIIEGNEAWGIGLGQIKTMGYDIIRSYYLYYTDHPVAIPNAAAETLTIFGWVGLSLRILVQAVLFILTKPWKNPYRLTLFFFIFIYQFTGSYITNLGEYVCWILAFVEVRGGRKDEAL